SQAGDGKTAQVFDIHSTQRGDGRLYFAIPADATMKAEAAQRDFVQTLTKTFAHLSIGLAIFDKERKLVLFNPALLDLMSLPVEFLSQQPTLTGFLDRLREERLIAEPRNYKAWRKRIVDLEAQAVDGSYCETWSLPGGVTFRVTGRPHPGGAIAFLFEDISAEMSLTRRFHAEIELGHAALDAVDEAIVIITTSGIVTLTNAPYREMWNSDADERVIPLRLREAVSLWRNEGDPEDPVWHALIDAVEQRNGPSAWHGQMTMADGRLLFCRTKRLTGGATLVGFKGPKPAAQNAPIATSDAAIEQREAG
ncbi:MAG: PAS-domain containing protein, partial [Pseudomonadota bacterium]